LWVFFRNKVSQKIQAVRNERQQHANFKKTLKFYFSETLMICLQPNILVFSISFSKYFKQVGETCNRLAHTYKLFFTHSRLQNWCICIILVYFKTNQNRVQIIIFLAFNLSLVLKLNIVLYHLLL